MATRAYFEGQLQTNKQQNISSGIKQLAIYKALVTAVINKSSYS